LSTDDQKNRNRALEIINQWIKEEEERIKLIEVTECTKNNEQK